jgi:UDP-glucose 4-epimerase
MTGHSTAPLGPARIASGRAVLAGKRVVVTGGTGSLGKRLTWRLLQGELGLPDEIVVFSRDEAKQHEMRLAFQQRAVATDEVVYEESQRRLRFRIGSVGDYASLAAVLGRADVVFNGAALKQVPTCEYVPFEAVQTNVIGAQNIVRAIRELRLEVETVVGISTDKACKPVNVMGMTKAIQERIFIEANIECPGTRFIAVRYGNVLASRGSVVPLFHHQIAMGGPVTITTEKMTRFLLSLDAAVDVVFDAISSANAGDIYVPRLPAARIVDLANVLIDERSIKIEHLGIRPGEKIHEVLVSEEESPRTVERGAYYVVQPVLPELCGAESEATMTRAEYTSAQDLLSMDEVAGLIAANGLRFEDSPSFS